MDECSHRRLLPLFVSFETTTGNLAPKSHAVPCRCLVSIVSIDRWGASRSVTLPICVLRTPLPTRIGDIWNLTPVQFVDLNICSGISHAVVCHCGRCSYRRPGGLRGLWRHDASPLDSTNLTRGPGSTGAAVRSRRVAVFSLKLCYWKASQDRVERSRPAPYTAYILSS